MVNFKVIFIADDPLNVSFSSAEQVHTQELDHNKLFNRDLLDQHPISAITALQTTLDKKVNFDQALTNYEINEILKY